MRVENFLSESALRLGGKTALVAGTTQLTYAEIDLMSSRMAAALTANGIALGDRVLVFMDNSWEAVVSIFAILKAGAVFAPIDPATGTDRLAEILNDCDAAGLVTQSRLAKVSAGAMAEAPLLNLTIIAGCEGAPEIDGIMRFEDAVAGGLTPRRAPAGIPADLAMIGYASDSAGVAKARMMTHATLIAAATSTTASLADRADDAVLSLPPVSSDRGLLQLLMAVKHGATLMLEKSTGRLDATA